MKRPFLTLSGLALLSLCGANTQAQPNRPAKQENNLTREQVRDAYKAPGAFLEMRNIPNLRNLNLARTPITGDGLQALSEQRFLTRLNLEESKANDDGMAFVFRLGALRELNLHGTAITSAGVKALGENSLVQLNIGRTKVNNDAFKSLSGMRSLRALYVFGTPLAANGVNQFKTPLPECTVITAPPKPPARNVDHAPRLPVES